MGVFPHTSAPALLPLAVAPSSTLVQRLHLGVGYELPQLMPIPNVQRQTPEHDGPRRVQLEHLRELCRWQKHGIAALQEIG